MRPVAGGYSQAFLVASVPASGRLRSDNGSHHRDFDIRCGDEYRTGKDFRQVSAPARTAPHRSSHQVIIAFHHIPALRLHLAWRVQTIRSEFRQRPINSSSRLIITDILLSMIIASFDRLIRFCAKQWPEVCFVNPTHDR